MICVLCSMTPFDVETTLRRANYNFAHSSTRMTIERSFGKFKGQWKLFATTLPRYYSDDLRPFLQAAFVMHNVTIDIDQAALYDPGFPDDAHSRGCIDERDAKAMCAKINRHKGREEKASAAAGLNIREKIAEYLELFVDED